MRVISRAEAKAQGLKYYFKGVPCKRGHLVKYEIKYGCVECRRLGKKSAYHRRAKTNFGLLLTASGKQRSQSKKLTIDHTNRKEAVALGLKRYFLGTPCKWGHVAERFTKDGGCMTCSVERQKSHRESAKRVKLLGTSPANLRDDERV